MRPELLTTLRSLRTRPLPAVVAVVCLALGIGANTVVFGVVDALLLRPPVGVSDPATLVRVRVGGAPTPLGRGAGPTASFPQYRRILEERAGALAGLAAYGALQATRGSGPDAEALDIRAVTPGYFPLLGVRPRLGHFFAPTDGATDGATGGATGGASVRAGTPVAVLSHRYWTRAWAADPSVAGKVLQVNGVPFTVIGVAPDGFVGVDLGDPDLWIPIGTTLLPELGGSGRLERGVYWLQFVGRLAPGVDLERARAMTASAPVGDPFVAQPVRPGDDGATGPRLPVRLLPLRTMFFADQRGQSPLPPWALAVSLAVLLLACATVANLQLAEAVRRRRDVAIRLAVGGTPARILTEQLVRSVLLALAAAGGAIVVTGASVVLVRSLPLPPLGALVNGRTLVVGVAVALLTPLLFGLAPALWAARRRVSEVLDERGGGLVTVSRLQHGLMAAQTAIGFVLLLVAALFLHSLRTVRALDTGMDVDRLLTVRLTRPGLSGADQGARTVAALERIGRIPGVDAVTVGGIVPFHLFRHGTFTADGRSEGVGDGTPVRALIDLVGPRYFRTLGIELAAGRAIGEGDRAGAPPVAVVSAPLAHRVWPGGDALGACLRLPGAFGEGCVEVVGIERGARYQGPFENASETVYLSASQLEGGMEGQTIFVRTRGEPSASVAAIRDAIQTLDPEMPWVAIEPLTARLRPVLIPWEVGAKLFSTLGFLAVLLAAVGLWMVVAFVAAQRTRELGIRAALGAGRSRLVVLVLLAGARVSATGLGVGAVVGACGAALFRARLYGVGFLDARTYLEVAALLAVVTALASLGPALRASSVRPADVLKGE